VTDHLTERLNLDSACALPLANSGSAYFEPKPIKATKKGRPATGQHIRLAAKKNNQNDVTTMSNNLMFRSMFFMNEEARHFLAPPIQLSTTDGEYFTRKTGNPNLNTHHQQQQQQAVAALVNHDSSSSVEIKPLQVRSYLNVLLINLLISYYNYLATKSTSPRVRRVWQNVSNETSFVNSHARSYW